MVSSSTFKDSFLSEKEAAVRLGVSRITLLRLRQAGKLAHYRIGTRVVFSEQQISDYLTSVERKIHSQGGAAT